MNPGLDPGQSPALGTWVLLAQCPLAHRPEHGEQQLLGPTAGLWSHLDTPGASPLPACWVVDIKRCHGAWAWGPRSAFPPLPSAHLPTFPGAGPFTR